jgi:small ligand-binding sensory domain FIST
MDLLSLATAAIWIDFFTVFLAKYAFQGTAIKQWYNQFQYVAVLSDVLSVMIGVLLGHILFPKMNLILASIIVQVVHDVFFSIVVLGSIPTGSNTMIDVLKTYATESSYGILLYDAFMMGSTVMLMNYLLTVKKEYVTVLALLGGYALTYIIYTK